MILDEKCASLSNIIVLSFLTAMISLMIDMLSFLSEWMRVNKLSPNPKKADFIVIGHPLQTKNLDLPEVLKQSNCDMKRAVTAKSLRVIIDEKLNCDEQFKRTKGKMSGGLAALKN